MKIEERLKDILVDNYDCDPKEAEGVVNHIMYYVSKQIVKETAGKFGAGMVAGMVLVTILILYFK